MILPAPSVTLPSLRREVIREALMRRIGSGELAPGDRIVEARLAEEFGVSAIPVREAIRELVSIGVLEFANHRGAWVRVVSLHETIEALEVKAALEAQAALTAAVELRGGGRELRRMCAAVERAARSGRLADYQVKNHRFHRSIVQAAGNAMLLRMWDSLAFEVRTRPILEFLQRESPVQLAAEHHAITEALVDGSGPRAAALLAKHATGLVAHLRAELASQAASSSTDHEKIETLSVVRPGRAGSLRSVRRRSGVVAPFLR